MHFIASILKGTLDVLDNLALFVRVNDFILVWRIPRSYRISVYNYSIHSDHNLGVDLHTPCTLAVENSNDA